MERIKLPEYQKVSVEAERLSLEAGNLLWQHYGDKISVEFPSPKTDGCWQLTNQGYVGHIPLTADYQLYLLPRIPLVNLFGMLEYAFDLPSVQLLPGLMHCETLPDFYEHLALWLAERVLQRVQQGIHRAYVPQQKRLSVVRGRVDVQHALRQVNQARLLCHYNEHTTDILDNQILAWTLHQILQTGLCHPQGGLPYVQRAYQALRGVVRVEPVSAEACVGRVYHRLNVDYQPMHHLCHFFLEMISPHPTPGQAPMLPFLVNMASLYERFVAGWLAENLPTTMRVNTQERVDLDKLGQSYFKIDLVLSAISTGETLCVLDTKYKSSMQIQPADLQQVTAYAASKYCQQAVLIYPDGTPQTRQVGEITVHALPFNLTGDLQIAGQKFLENMGLGV